jgi:hypothetical protein
MAISVPFLVIERKRSGVKVKWKILTNFALLLSPSSHYLAREQ